MRILLSIMSSFLLVACSSIPLSTTLKMASMDEHSIGRINPEAIRVRLTLDKPVELMEKNVRLVLDYERDHVKDLNLQQSHYEFILKLLSKKELIEKSFFSRNKAVTQYEFSINDTSRRDFYRHQRDFMREGKPNKYRWTVYYYLQNMTEAVDELTLDVELKLYPDEDYFYLFKDAQIEVNQ